MKKITLEQLGPMLKERRGTRGLREVAKEIGISSATLSRVETGKQPDLETFSKLCKWLGIDAGEILGCASPGSHREQSPSAASDSAAKSFPVYAHFRAHRTMKPETAKYLSELILAAQSFLEDEDHSIEEEFAA